MHRSTLRIVITVLAIVMCRPALAQTGACCLDNGFCIDLVTPVQCGQLGGDYQGHGTDCVVGLCTPVGACCLDDGNCIQETQAGCSSTGGDYQGDGTLCAQVSCIGACCFLTGTCVSTDFSLCISVGGTYFGDGVSCADVTCAEPLGACCYGFDSCQENTVPSACDALGGTFQGFASTCADRCTGACCFGQGVCSEESAADCNILGASYQGHDSECDEVPCGTLLGACCNLPNGGCQEVDEGNCVTMAGTFNGAGTTCDEICPVCPGEGDCFANNGNAGCNQATCCELVCSLDPFCCEVLWDEVCAQLAADNCDPCPCDSDGSGTIDTVDLLEVLGDWGGGSLGDCTGDGVTDVADLLSLLGTWGPCE